MNRIHYYKLQAVSVLLICCFMLSACGSKNEGTTAGRDKQECSTEELNNMLKKSSFGGECGENSKWFYNDGTLVIYGTGTIEKTTWVSAFKEGKIGAFENIIIDEGITNTSLFWNGPDDLRKNIKSISLPSTLEIIDDHAFDGMKQVESITIPKSVSKIGAFAFSGCNSLANVSFEKDSELQILGEYAFGGCPLEIFAIPKGVTDIGAMAFWNCDLRYIDIPNTVKHIGEHAFSQNKMQELYIPESVTQLDEKAIDCNYVTYLILPESAKKGSVINTHDAVEIKFNGDPNNLFDDDAEKSKVVTYVPADEYSLNTVNSIINQLDDDRSWAKEYSQCAEEAFINRTDDRDKRIFGLYINNDYQYPLFCVFDDTDEFGINDLNFHLYEWENFFGNIDEEAIKQETTRLNYLEIMKVLAHTDVIDETIETEEAVDSAMNNEDAISMEAYQEFIDSGESLYFDIYDMEGFEKDKAYSLEEFLKTKKKNYDPALYKYYDLEYAFIDCGDDGVKELLIRYAFTGEMSEYEGDYVFENVIKYVDGKLEVCAEACSHYRYNETINGYGIISDAFIDFAGANIWSSERGVDKNGVVHEIKSSSMSYAEAIPGIYSGYSSDEPDFSGLSDMCSELGEDFYVYKAEFEYGSMKDQKIYSYELSGNEQYRDAIEDVFNKANVKLLQSDEYDKVVKRVIEEFGLTEEAFNAGEPNFTAFPETVGTKTLEPWEEAYETYLYDLLSGKEYMHDMYEVYSIAGPDAKVLIALDDITEDGIPELWIYTDYNDDFVLGSVLSYKDGSLIFVNDAMNSYYNPESKALYANEGGYAEIFTVYGLEDGAFVKKYELWNDGGYYIINGDNTEESISEEQANAMITEYEDGKEKYTLKPIEVSINNVEDVIEQY